MIGSVVSMTCISCSNVDELPDMSIMVQVTIVVPNSNDTGASLDTNATSVLSLDSIDGNSNRLSILFIASKLNDSGCSITGDVVSMTEIV